MKTGRLLKITLSIAILAFISGNVFGQELNDGTNDLPNLAEDADGTAVEEVTAGYAVPYYVTPDPVLNDFTEPYVIGDDGQGLNSSWVWSLSDGSHGTISQGSAGQGGSESDHPYVEVTWERPTNWSAGGTSGDATSISVQEEGPSGTCTGPTKTLTVNVFDPPEFNVVDDGTANGHDLTNELCETTTASGYDVLLENITDNGVTGGNFKFRMDIGVDTLNSDLSQDEWVRNGTDQQDTIVTISETYGNDVTLLSGYDMPAVNGQITRYRFDFGDNLYSTGNSKGITDHILRKSQYLDNPNGEAGNNDQGYTYIADSDNASDGSMITFIIYPQPETGNIHYVPNNFDQ